MICAVFCSTIACIGYLCLFNITFLLLIKIVVSWYMKMVQVKKFLVHWYWWRMESGSYITSNEVSENFSAMRLRIEVSKLHV